MEPEIGLAVEKDRTAGPARASLLIPAIEVVGLAIVILGLAAGRVWLALLGGAPVVASYASYRRKHGAGATSGNSPEGSDNDVGDRRD